MSSAALRSPARACRLWPEAAPSTSPKARRCALNGGATLVLDSEGGSVVDTIALGRALRRLDVTTSVGKAVIGAAADGSTTLSPAASCESMCAFVLLGGARRYVP